MLTNHEIIQDEYIYLSRIKYDVLKFIKHFYLVKQYSPTLLEIGKEFSFSRARAGVITSELMKLNLISKGRSAHRKIRMTKIQLDKVDKVLFNREYSLRDLKR